MDYKYTAISEGNVLISGTIAAADTEAAEGALSRKGVRVISMQGGGRGLSIPGLTLTSTKVSRKEITIFSQQLASLMDAGVPLMVGLQLLQEQAKSKAFKEVIASM